MGSYTGTEADSPSSVFYSGVAAFLQQGHPLPSNNLCQSASHCLKGCYKWTIVHTWHFARWVTISTITQCAANNSHYVVIQNTDSSCYLVSTYKARKNLKLDDVLAYCSTCLRLVQIALVDKASNALCTSIVHSMHNHRILATLVPRCTVSSTYHL